MNAIPHVHFDSAPTAGISAALYSGSRWPEPLTAAAFCGLAGEYVRLVEPASEADRVALLLQFLVAAGSVIGHRPFYLAEDTPHHLNLYTVLVGMSSKSRKGTSWGRVKKLFTSVENEWGGECISSGLSSGEGLIETVRDGDITDKRLLVCQGEFCSVLQSMERSGNTLSMVLRDAWDGETLRTMTRKNNALRATGAHISMIGHITRDELRASLTETDKANGFANRILWACIARSKELPDGGEVNPDAWADMTRRVSAAVNAATTAGLMLRSSDASELWRSVYHELSASQPGMFGAVTSRGEAQVVRLSCLYALLDNCKTIEAEHMQAAPALWRYCEDSARFIFGSATGDPVADMILAVLKESDEGMTRTEISDLFGRNKSAGRISAALSALSERGLVQSRREETQGRWAEVWFAIANGTK
jgi:Protein of unknown function (DUF3987)